MRTKFNLIESQTNYKLDYFSHSSPQEEVFVLTGLHLLLPKEKPMLSTSAQNFEASQAKTFTSQPLQNMRPTDTVNNVYSPGDFLRASDHPSRIGDMSRTGEYSRVAEMNAKQYNTISTFNGQCNPAKPVLNSGSINFKAPIYPNDSPNKNFAQNNIPSANIKSKLLFKFN
jgi:hypothetical protein